MKFIKSKSEKIKKVFTTITMAPMWPFVAIYYAILDLQGRKRRLKLPDAFVKLI